MKEINLSEYGKRSLIPAPISRMNSQFALDFRDGFDINLGVGYVNEDTIPNEAIGEAYREVVRPGSIYRQPLNYGSAEGSPRLLQSIRNYYLTKAVGGVDEAALGRQGYHYRG